MSVLSRMRLVEVRGWARVSADRVVDVSPCETEGCANDPYPGESLCLGCYRKTIRRTL